MLAKHRCRPIIRYFCVRIIDRAGDRGYGAENGMLQFQLQPACLHLGICEDVCEGVNRSTGDACVFERVDPVATAPSAEYFIQDWYQLAAMIDARGIVCRSVDR